MERHLQQTLALAGIAQAAFLVHQLAHHGLAAHDKMTTAVNSLFVTHPKVAADVFGQVSKLNLGLQVLQEILAGNSAVFSPTEVLRYQMGLLYLEHKLAGKRGMLDAISTGLDTIRRRFPEIEVAGNPEALKEVGRLYQDTLSTLPFRIQVRGDMNFLKNEHVACKVRVALFAGVRAAVLWRQVGGRRWHLLIHRKRIARDVNRLLLNLPG